MNSPTTSGTADPRYSKRLAIVVPYRDRADHLARFVPHIAAYFERDKLDRQIAVTINIIEQWGNAPFSRGRLANCGFLLTQDTSDYVCIHDVDYLPMWADYSWTANPARLIWHGLSMRENWETFFGAVSLLDKSVFTAVNGFPNCYWGWGPEDLEMSTPAAAARLQARAARRHLHPAAAQACRLFRRRTSLTMSGAAPTSLFEKREPDFEKLIAAGRHQYAEIPPGREKAAGAADHAGFAERLPLHCRSRRAGTGRRLRRILPARNETRPQCPLTNARSASWSTPG